MSASIDPRTGYAVIQHDGVDSIQFDNNGLKIESYPDGVITGAKLASDVPFRKGFTSAEQTITSGGTLSIAHGLGVAPSVVTLKIVCKVANVGYAVGDELDFPTNVYATSVSDNYGISTYVNDNSNVKIKFGANGALLLAVRLDNGSGAALINTSWKLVVRAFA